MQILVLSRSENVHVDMVEKYCNKYARVDRINFDFDTTSPNNLPLVSLGADISSVPDAVFIHHPRISYKNEWFADEIERKLFVASWDSVKEWMEYQFSKTLWVNRPSQNSESKNILRQYNIARAFGFVIPETIFTNQFDELKAFANSSRIVIKQGNLGVNLENKRILTSVVNVHTINKDVLRGCPCLFQKYVPKKFELRVHVIGDTVLTCKIDSQASEKTKIDWRNYDLENTPHEAFMLDDTVNKQCVKLVRELGLMFGILDLIVTPRDDLVFLECNAQGHWAWIEQITGLPITEVLCNFLLAYGSA